MSLTAFTALERRASSQRQQAQASARPARIRFFADVVGAGEGEARFEDKNKLMFSAYLLEEPLFTYGVALLNHSLPEGQLPLVTACVLDYEINDRGFYTGANIGLRVRTGAERVSLRFSLIFDGYALRSTSRVSNVGGA